VVIGAGIGVILCLATSRVLSGLLFGVSPHDGVTFAGVPLLLVATAVVASWLPARRALRVHPVEALREN
jgi:ABC-type antimicrobial peptide transport system permease subunit